VAVCDDVLAMISALQKQYPMKLLELTTGELAIVMDAGFFNWAKKIISCPI